MNTLLEVKNISKSFGATQALRNAQFQLLQGEIHALLGENGAGKSTLIKILAGVHKKDSGIIYLNGKEYNSHNPRQSNELGIATVFQELSLCLNLSIAENIFVNRIPSHFGLINFRKLYSDTTQYLNEFQIKLNPETPLRELNLGQRQLIEIIKAFSLEAKILILDEPTSALEITEVNTLFTLLNKLKQKGTGIIFVSHKLNEVFQISDRITVFRDGEHISTKMKSETTHDETVKFMIGRDIHHRTKSEAKIELKEVLSIKNFSLQNKFSGINFVLHEKEILGFAGLNGSGRTELMQSIFGYLPKDNGVIFLNGKEINIKVPADAIKNGIVYSPEDRKDQGLFLNHSIIFNTIALNLKNCSNFLLMNKNAEKETTDKYIEKLSIKVNDPLQAAHSLSGGNQQKVLLSKCLAAKPKILIVDEPTRGIDIGSKLEIHKILGEFISGGGSIILVSSDLPEIISLSNRIIVFKEGKIIGEMTENITENSIMSLIFKHSHN